MTASDENSNFRRISLQELLACTVLIGAIFTWAFQNRDRLTLSVASVVASPWCLGWTIGAGREFKSNWRKLSIFIFGLFLYFSLLSLINLLVDLFFCYLMDRWLFWKMAHDALSVATIGKLVMVAFSIVYSFASRKLSKFFWMHSICFILTIFLLLIPKKIGESPNPRVMKTHAILRDATSDIDMYFKNHPDLASMDYLQKMTGPNGKLQIELLAKALFTRNRGNPVDGWGYPLVVRVQGKNDSTGPLKILIYSIGPDGVDDFGNNDDIRLELLIPK